MTPQIKQRIDQIRRGEVPEGYKRTKVGIVPEEWEERFLGNYIQEYKELSNDIEKYPVYSSSRQGLIPQSQYYDNREAVETNLGYKIVPNGYVTYRHMSDDDVFHFNVNNTGGEILVSSEYPVFSSTEKSSLGYIIPMLNDTAHFRYFCRTQKMGGTRTRLYYKNLCTYKSVYPPLVEQEKIAEIFQTHDKLIELQQKKIDELKRLKKAYLSKMFPKKGCNVPEIRFPGFTDPWEQRKFSDFTFPAGEKNKNDLPLEPYAITNEHGFIAQSEAHDDFGYMQDVNRKMYIIVKPNSFAYNPARINVGSLGYYEGTENVIISSLYEVFRTVDGVDDIFLNQWFKTKDFMDWISKLQEGSVRQYFYYDKLCECKMCMPSVEEQQQIGSFFKKIDNLITLHQRKVGEMMKYKNSLIQLLLTGIVRVTL